MPYRRFHSLPQLALALSSCCVAALLLESGGLLAWATRLELGPERTFALPAATALDRTLRPLRLDALRTREILALSALHWSSEALPDAEANSEAKAALPAVSIVSAATTLPRPPLPPTTPRAATPLLPLATPPLTSHLPPLGSTGSSHSPRTVALTGDSMMAVGLAPELLREVARYPQLTLRKAFRSGTGLARPEVFDWLTQYPTLLGPAHPDLILVALGGNDGQGFVEEGTTYFFGTPQWAALYQRRVQAFLALLTANGATVVWIGLPPMRSPDYDARLALVSRIQYTVVAANPHALWFSTAGLVGDPTGRYQDFGLAHGSLARLRQPDGIHLSDEGAAVIAAHLLPWLAANHQNR